MNQNKLVIFSFIIFALLFSCKSSKVSIAEAYNTPEEFITTLQKNESIGINPLIFYKGVKLGNLFDVKDSIADILKTDNKVLGFFSKNSQFIKSKLTINNATDGVVLISKGTTTLLKNSDKDIIVKDGYLISREAFKKLEPKHINSIFVMPRIQLTNQESYEITMILSK